jgi:hypothetical protein
MAKYNMESTLMINKMAAASLIMSMVSVIGGNSINIRGKDMEQ